MTKALREFSASAEREIPWGPFWFGAVLQFTVFFSYLMPFASPPLVAVVACAAVLFRQLYKHGTLDRGVTLFCIAWSAIVLWGVLYRLLLTGEWGDSMRVAENYLIGALIILAAVHVVQGSEIRLISLLSGLFLVTVIGLIISFANYYASFFLDTDFLVEYKRAGSLAQYHRSRMMGTVGNPNNFAAIVLTPFAVLLALVTERTRWSTAFLFMLLAAALVFASSRGVLLGVAVIFLWAAWVAAKKRHFTRFILLFIVPVALCVALLVIGSDVARIDQLLDRLLGLEGAGVDSINLRFDIWSAYFGVFAENPHILLFGNGVDNYLVSRPPENGYLKLINEFGIPITFFLVLLACLLCYSLYRAQSHSIFARAGFFLVVSLMTANLSNEVIDGRSFWIGLGIAYASLLLYTGSAAREKGGGVTKMKNAPWISSTQA